MTIPDNFKTGITGAELLKVGIQCAEDAGFKWPDDWQMKFKLLKEGWCIASYDLLKMECNYRINPERMKPKAPRVGKMCRNNKIYDVIDAIELTDQVRRRLGKDAGVDTKNLTHVITTCRNVNLSSKDITSRIMELIAAAAVEVEE